MDFDPHYFGPQEVNRQDAEYRPLSFAAIKKVLFANRYYLHWKAEGSPPLPTYNVTLWRGLYLKWRQNGLLWPFQAAARRTVTSRADLRWGGAPGSGKGFRRLIHPNAVCLFGEWRINEDVATEYTGYFKAGSRGLILGRYSTCCAETRRGYYRSLSLVGKIFPTLSPDVAVAPANFITQEDLGGSNTPYINDIETRNAPDVTPFNRHLGIFFLLLTTFVLLRADKRATIRQLYEIAELGKPKETPTRAPKFMRLTVKGDSRRIEGQELDFRDEVLHHIYEPGAESPTGKLAFKIEVSDDGEETELLMGRRNIQKWTEIGEIVFDDAVASYNGDFVLHFHHPEWRNNRNDPKTVARPRL